MKSISPLLAVLVVCVGCDKKVESVSSVEAPSSDSSPSPTTRQLVLVPEVDATFADVASVEAWRVQIATIIEGAAAVPHPRDVWRYTADFHVDRSRPDPILGTPESWDAINVIDRFTDEDLAPVPAPSAEEAQALEDQDEEWEAADRWIALNRLDDAKRCGAKLEEEGEWKAVAMIAVHTGDLVALDRATGHLVDDDQVSRTQDVATYAFSHGKVDVARHIAERYEWKLSEILDLSQVRELALTGDATFLLERLERKMTAWERGEWWTQGQDELPSNIVADIVILARIDPAKAKEYASRYLHLPAANVFIWIECGEGCYSSPVLGALELYQLVRTDTELRELYLARLGQAVDVMFPVLRGDDQGMPPIAIAGLTYGEWYTVPLYRGGEYNTQLLSSYLLRVRQVSDAQLTFFWTDTLDRFATRTNGNGEKLIFERELGRCTFGLPFVHVVEDVGFDQQTVLQALAGLPTPDVSDVWTAWDTSLPGYDEVGHIEWLFGFLLRGSIQPARAAVIRAELNIEVDDEVRQELESLMGRSIDAHYRVDWDVDRRLEEAVRALAINSRSARQRVDLGLPAIDLYPDADTELVELLAPSLALMQAKLPAVYRGWAQRHPQIAALVEAQMRESVATADESDAPVTSASTVQSTVTDPPARDRGDVPMYCGFVNGNRPKVGEKYILRCDGGALFLALGEYVGGGVFAFHDYEPHIP